MTMDIVLSTSGQARGDKIEISIGISDNTAERLFDEAFKGWCPICRNINANVSEIICCDCLARVMAYHHEHCDCLEAPGRDEAHDEQIPA